MAKFGEYERIIRCRDRIREFTDFVPKAAIVLGSGLGDFADSVKEAIVVDYRDIEDFPRSTVEGHRGRFVFGYINDVPVVIMQGRVHLYEGYSPKDVVLPIRVMNALGAKKLILTNAAGGINEGLSDGGLMLITDHISSFVKSPLIGENIDELGTRFPDMTEVYSKRLSSVAESSAEALGIKLTRGVYIQLTGPAYETPVEVRMCKTLGADAVGMSTAIEAMAAKHAGMEICGISCVTNMAAGISVRELSHEDVKRAAAAATADFSRLLSEIIRRI